MYDDLHILPKLRDGLSFIYLEHGRLEQDDSSVTFVGKEEVIPLPSSSLAVILLGPGTSVTHAAMKSMAACGASVVWVGSDMNKFYASGMGETRKSTRILRQALLWSHPLTRTKVVREMYAIRFDERLEPSLTIDQIRGKEGVRVRTAYSQLSKETGIEWRGRNYDRGSWESADPVNRALSFANACLYGLCHAAIVSVGYSPAIGFIHTGKQLSFVYDIADLYKTEVTIPAAFSSVAEHGGCKQREVRRKVRDMIYEHRILKRIVPDIDKVLSIKDDDIEYGLDIDPAMPGWLWGEEGVVPGGVNHGRDDSGEGPREAEG